MRRLILLPVVVVFATAGLVGCRNSAIAEGKRAVRDYCEAVIIAYRTQNTDDLHRAVTEREFRKIFSLIDIKTAAGLVLESTLEELTVRGVEEAGPHMMTVATTERWRYFDRPLAVGEEPGTEFVVEMDLEYTFILSDGAWKMDQARTLRHTYLQPKGYSHEEADPHGKSHGESHGGER